MSGQMSPDAGPGQSLSCGFCGRALGREYYYTCHVCGATYCYSHRPAKCLHKRPQPPLALRK